MTVQWECLDGNEAAARVAYPLSEVISIFPITPASPMAEHADDWAAAGRPNLWGSVPDVVEMQSEGGAAGAMHGALQKGALATTFTASQGLLLMIPNMFKIAGELTPAVIHVAARTIATHALSIFGDHSDVMHARSTGWAMLAASSVQEAHDMALVAHAATLRSRIPFLHFFDGFRTSHEVNKIALLTEDDIRALVRDEDVLAFRARGLTPDAPVVRGTAQNPDVFFQAREASNPFYIALPAIVEDVMRELGERTGRRYGLVDYTGAPDADRVVVVMGSGAGAVAETVDALTGAGERVGMLNVRLFQPFPTDAILAALPKTTRSIAVLDRTKEPGAVGEPLYLALRAAIDEAMDADAPPFAAAPRIIGGRYGLSSKEVTPGMIKPVFDELAAGHPKRHFTIGIYDDVTNLSLPIDGGFRPPRPAGEVQAIFFGLGADGTVGANKASVKIIGEGTDLYAQGYFVYDSKKSGSMTVSHLRFGPEPVRSTYLVEDADFVACHQWGLLEKTKVLEHAKRGATVLLNAPYAPDQVWEHLPRAIQEEIVERELDLWVIDAVAVAAETGMGSRINTIMQPCFFQLAGVLPAEDAIRRIKAFVAKTYSKRGEAIVERNYAAIDRSLERLVHVPRGAVAGAAVPAAAVAADAPDFVREVTARLMAGEGDLLPVSAMPPDGTFPTGTTRWEKRAIAQMIPVWDESICIDCGKCAIVCPHATIRMKVFPEAAVADAPSLFKSKVFKSRELADHRLTIQVAPGRLHGLRRLCRRVPGEIEDGGAPQGDQHGAGRGASRRGAGELGLLHVDRAARPEPHRARHGQGQPGARAALRVLGRMQRMRRDAVPQARQPAVRRPDGRRERDRLLLDLRREPADDAVDRERPGPRSGMVELALRGQRRVRARDAPRTRRPDRPRARCSSSGSGRRWVQSSSTRCSRTTRRPKPTSTRQRVAVRTLRAALERLGDGPHAADARHLMALADDLVRRGIWIIGGDGWAYDIGFGGLDAVLAFGPQRQHPRARHGGLLEHRRPGVEGDASRRRGEVRRGRQGVGQEGPRRGRPLLRQRLRRPGLDGRQRPADDEGAPRGRCLAAVRRSSSRTRTCIAHGIDMSKSMTHQKDAVRERLLAALPVPSERGRTTGQPFKLDSQPPTIPVRDFVATETRFAILAAHATRTGPPRWRRSLQADADERWRYYEQLAGMHRTVPHLRPDPEVTPEVESDAGYRYDEEAGR